MSLRPCLSLSHCLFAFAIVMGSSFGASAAAVEICVSAFSARTVTNNTPFLPDQLRNEISTALNAGNSTLKDWQARAFPGQTKAFDSLRVISTNDSEFPYELHVGANRLFRLRRQLGEGKHGVVYLTENNEALKILKHLDFPRELALQAYFHSVWAAEGIRVPRVLELDPGGNYLLLEYVSGKTIYELSKRPETVSRDSKALVDIHRAALRIVKSHGVFFDLKAANFIQNESGQMTFVDVAPRLDEFRYIYTQHADGKALSRELFAEHFLYRQHRDEELYQEFRVEVENLRHLDLLERIQKLKSETSNRSFRRHHLSQAFTVPSTFTLSSAWKQLHAEKLPVGPGRLARLHSAFRALHDFAVQEFAQKPDIRTYDILTFARSALHNEDPIIASHMIKELQLKFILLVVDFILRSRAISPIGATGASAT